MTTPPLQHEWLWLKQRDLETELLQLRDEGKEVGRLANEFGALIKLGDKRLFDPAKQAAGQSLLEEAQRLPQHPNYEFREPSDLTSIRKLRTSGPRRLSVKISRSQLTNHMLGAWLGRCAGCLLGKPIEGERTPALWGFLKATGQWPLADYISFARHKKALKAFPSMASRGWTENLTYFPLDDDTNYTVTNLLIIEKHGADFTPVDVARFWLEHLPLLSTCTAERIAYRNLALHIQPPASATYVNPYREWIGAQIRADAFGYVNVGNPERAAEFAWRDASISHIKNGIYGEMLMAALIAAAPFNSDPTELLRVGLSEIPRTSRLFADITNVLAWHAEGIDYDEAILRLREQWDEENWHDWTHTNSNAMVCAIALLWGKGDFGLSICRAVQPGFDTDCNGATVGSIVGMMIGAKKIPARWTETFNNTLHTSLQGNDIVKIDAMAERSVKMWEKMRT